MTGGCRDALAAKPLRAVYDLLLRCYGTQGWWPGETPFEVMVGAILTQNTSWSNVEQAIANLKQTGLLQPDAMLRCPVAALARVIRPAGYFNVKASRLRNLCLFLDAHGSLEALSALPDRELRDLLLAVGGIGPETADDILLYGLQRPFFVIDAYTRRVFSRLGVIQGDETYERLRRRFEKALGPDVRVMQEYHALIVRHAKHRCRKQPVCAGCCLYQACDLAKEPVVAASRSAPPSP